MGGVEIAFADFSLVVAAGELVAVRADREAGDALLRLLAGAARPAAGTLTVRGEVGVLAAEPVADDRPVRELLAGLAPARVRAAARAVDAAELAMMAQDDAPARGGYERALAAWGESGGYRYEEAWGAVAEAVLGAGLRQVEWQEVSRLTPAERRALAWEALLRGPQEVLVVAEPARVPWASLREAADLGKAVLWITAGRTGERAGGRTVDRVPGEDFDQVVELTRPGGF
jgi:ATPase subunit of ABC transporter with duplicated ATPase domains